MAQAVSEFWTDDRVAALGRMWSAGHSASAIAAELGNGATRSAVIGKVHRLGLAGRRGPPKPPATKRPATPQETSRPADAVAPQADPAPGATRAERSAAKKPAPVAPTAPVVARPDPVAVLFGADSVPFAVHGLTRTTCRFTIGDPVHPTHAEPFRFCGARVVADGKPYCADHHRLAYQGTAPRLVPASRAGALNGRAA